MRYFGVSQMCHGHEYRWIFDGETLVKELKLNNEDEIEDCDGNELLFPIGGSNSSCTWISELKTDKETKGFIISEGDGPDSDDPILVDIAEYLLTISTDDGSCTQMFLDKFELEARTDWDYNAGTKDKVRQLIEGLKEAGYEDFDYENPFYGDNCDMRLSELEEIYDEVTHKYSDDIFIPIPEKKRLIEEKIGTGILDGVDDDCYRFIFKAMFEYGFSFNDADKWAWLNTLFGYEIEFYKAIRINRWLYENDQDIMEFGAKDKSTLEMICKELDLKVDFSKFVTEEPKAIKYSY